MPFAVSDALFIRIRSCIYVVLKLQPVSGRFQGDPCCIATLRSPLYEMLPMRIWLHDETVIARRRATRRGSTIFIA
jgi:hypothetical protein